MQDRPDGSVISGVGLYLQRLPYSSGQRAHALRRSCCRFSPKK